MSDGSPLARIIDAGWRSLASERTTALLVVVLAAGAALASIVPQGSDAIDAARSPYATQLHQLAAWGLTDVFRSAWVMALGALLAGNLAARVIGAFGADPSRVPAAPPPEPPLERTIVPRYPESTVETLRALFVARLGAPRAERFEGSRTSMAFELRGARAGPIVTHAGIIVLLVAAGLHAAAPTGQSTVPRGVLDVTHAKTRATGTFDMVAGQPIRFFTFDAVYSIVGYDRARKGLGPALQMERREGNQRVGESFWVYRDAPPGFDGRHRGG